MKLCNIGPCNRHADNDLCRWHEAAKENLEEIFFNWKKAYGVNYSWEKYLKALLKEGIGVGDLVVDIVNEEIRLLEEK